MCADLVRGAKDKQLKVRLICVSWQSQGWILALLVHTGPFQATRFKPSAQPRLQPAVCAGQGPRAHAHPQAGAHHPQVALRQRHQHLRQVCTSGWLMLRVGCIGASAHQLCMASLCGNTTFDTCPRVSHPCLLQSLPWNPPLAAPAASAAAQQAAAAAARRLQV